MKTVENIRQNRAKEGQNNNFRLDGTEVLEVVLSRPQTRARLNIYVPERIPIQEGLQRALRSLFPPMLCLLDDWEAFHRANHLVGSVRRHGHDHTDHEAGPRRWRTRRPLDHGVQDAGVGFVPPRVGADTVPGGE